MGVVDVVEYEKAGKYSTDDCIFGYGGEGCGDGAAVERGLFLA